MKFIFAIVVLILCSSCWPTSISLVDNGSMDPAWKVFHVETLKNEAPNTPMSYSATLSEDVKDGVQNNTRLLLGSSVDSAQVLIEGSIVSYSITPVALQEGDNSAQNRLTVSVRFEIFITEPEEDKMMLTSTRFVDYPSSQDLGSVETELLEELNTQIVQDVVNKLLSNW